MVIFETSSRGISGFLEAIEKLGSMLENASVADRTAGKAIALLCAYAKIKAVYAITLSQKGKKVLEENSIYHEWSNLVENILDVNKAAICPFEKMATEISDPREAYERLKAMQHSMKQCK
jgi:predicted RNA methylase